MSEYEVAMIKVLPYVRKNLRWPEQLISRYGRVPVQVGGSTVWADFVCYISRDQKPVPWLLIEVKQAGVMLEDAFPQAESYSLILGAPFFCITDGDRYDFYMTGDSQGRSIGLQSLPPSPAPEYLATGVEYIFFPSSVDDLIELFLVGLKSESKFFRDTKKHDNDVKQLHRKVFQRINSISPKELKDVIDRHMMMKLPNKNLVFRQVDEEFDKFQRALRFMRDFTGDPVININKLIDRAGNLYIKGGGIFFITQLLAGAHPDEFVVLEENVSKALRYLGVTDILVKNDTANGYIYVNDICKKLFQDKLAHRVRDHGFGLATVHNFLWHYYVYYRTTKKWCP